MSKIAIGCDHAGFPYKDTIVKLLEERGFEIIDYGTDSPDSVDYPDFVHPVADVVQANQTDYGVLICGSGNGVAMTANKHKGIRAAVAWNTDSASLARAHNNANILAIPARFVDLATAQEIVRAFFDSEFEGGRHARRVDKIDC
jgi:ribose 5-phosphate isomerase B